MSMYNEFVRGEKENEELCIANSLTLVQMITNSGRRNSNQLESCQKFARKLS